MKKDRWDIYKIQGGGKKQKAGYYSAFHRNFRGYYEYTEVDGNGKKHIRRIYPGIYYSPDLNARQVAMYKIMYWLLFLLSGALYLYAATRMTIGNTSWVVSIPQLGQGLGYIWAGISLVNYVFAPLKRTKHEHFTTHNYILMASIGTMGFGLLSAAALAGYCQFVSGFTALDGWSLAGYVLSAGVMLWLNRMEHNVTFTETQSKEKIPDDAVEL